MLDGRNDEPDRYGVSVVLEPGARLPYPRATEEAVARFAAVLARDTPLHPDCVVAMEEIPHMKSHVADRAERAVARAARAAVPVPKPDRKIEIRRGERRLSVAVEVRRPGAGIRTGMMLRKQFEGKDRGMLFVYDERDYRHFWMKNCRIDIDLAYIRNGKIDQIETMKAEPDTARSDLKRYSSRAAIRYVLEMPAGWMADNDVRVGDAVVLQPPPGAVD